MRYRSDQECLANGGCLLPGRPGSPVDLERLVDEIQMPHGPLERFVFMQAQPVPTADGVDVRISYRCWPENRYVEVRQAVNRLGPAVFASDPFPAMVTPSGTGTGSSDIWKGRSGPVSCRFRHRDQLSALHHVRPG